ncbi:hypothetical protein [Novipirellula caenicola]|uniref:hypothetical protein n=1 Tax=Novipirellula caenicola TaxID=1536901 RepID=UPI0031E505CD
MCIACFFAWRNRDPESGAITAVENANGRVHFKYQGPAIAPYPDDAAVPGDSIYISQLLVKRFGATEPPIRTLTEFLVGSNPERRVVAVELSLAELKPKLLATLKSLPDLDTIVVEMPTQTIARTSKEMRTLDNIQALLSVNIQMTFDRGLTSQRSPP